jgi:DNA-binding transcriptional ArsR family regulator
LGSRGDRNTAQLEGLSFFAPANLRTTSVTKLIDRIRHDIQHRLDQLLAEADKLRHALAALDPRERSTPEPKPTSSQPTAKRAANTPKAPKQTSARTRTRAASTANGASASARTDKVKVLAALSSDQALTAGEVAKATGLARPTVSTTLSKLSKTGEVVKAARGYGLPRTDGTTVSAAEPAAASATAEA